MKKKNTLKIIAAAGAFAMALTLLPAGSAQAAATYMPTKEVHYSYEDGKWEKSQSVGTSYNKRGAVVKNVTTRFESDGKEVSTTKHSYKGSKLVSVKTYGGNKLSFKQSISYKKGLPSVLKKYYVGQANPFTTKTVFKYKGKKPVTISFYYGNSKIGYVKYKYKKGKLISISSYSGKMLQHKDSYKNGDLVKSVSYISKGKPEETKKYTYKKHKLVKSVFTRMDGTVITTYYNNKGLPETEEETSTDSSSVYTTTYSYKYYKNTVKECISRYVDPNDLENISCTKTVYSGFKKFKSAPKPSIVEDYLGAM